MKLMQPDISSYRVEIILALGEGGKKRIEITIARKERDKREKAEFAREKVNM